MKNKPIQNIEAELNLLQLLVYDNDRISTVAELLKPEHFSKREHRIIFKAMLELFSNGMTADTVSLYEAVKEEDVDISFVAKLNETPASRQGKYLVQLIYEKHLQRILFKTATTLIEKVQDGTADTFELIAEAINQLQEVTGNISLSEMNLYERLEQIISDIKSRKEKDIRTLQSQYFPTFNKITNGLQYGNFICISGKEKNGKTTFAYKLSLDFAINSKIPIGVFSFEMSQDVLDWKALSLELGVDYNKLRNPRGYNNAPETELTEEELQHLAVDAGRKFVRSKIYTCDSVLNEMQIKAKMKKWMKDYGIKFFVIDYIGLIPSSQKHDSREREIAYLSRFFKLTAQEMQVIIVVLSQQNREGDIAESKALERDADFAFTIYKPFDDGIESIKMNFGDRRENIPLTDNDYIITLKRSRHGKQGKQFLAGYPEDSNIFVEKDISRSY